MQVSRWEQPLPVRGGDVFLLCSDGLSDLVEDEEIAALAVDRHGADACKALVALAASRGGHDNITVAMLRISAHAAAAGRGAGDARSAGAAMIGQTLGTYRLVEKLGEGGMGEVYRALDEMLDRDVALKMLRPELARRQATVDRFRAEAITLAKLDHPGIARIHGCSRHDDRWFIVMEFVRGETLLARLGRAGRLPWTEAVPIVCQLLDALEYAHRRGVIHRDMKPANVLMSDRRRASRSPTSASRGSSAPSGRRAPATSSARSSTCRPSRSAARRSTAAPISTPSASCSTSCSPAACRSAAPPSTT